MGFHVIFMLLVPEEAWQRLVLPALFCPAALTFPCPLLQPALSAGGLAWLPAYVTASLQFLTRTLETGASLWSARPTPFHHQLRVFGACREHIQPKATPTICARANCNCELTTFASCIINIAHCMLSHNQNCHLK